MKPVAIFRHTLGEGPGYFADFLSAHHIPVTHIRIDEGDAVPTDATAFSGLAFMGGPMSVNDDLPWIPQELALIRHAVASNIPVIGHCLGGQLMSKALGGSVTRNPVKEIGWGAVTLHNNAVSRQWFGALLDSTPSFESFHWHGETFTLPQDSTLLMSSPHCAHQAYVLGPHLGMQCHVEMTPEMIANWCISGKDELAHCAAQTTVQQAHDMQQGMESRIEGLRKVANQLYSKWIAGLQH